MEKGTTRGDTVLIIYGNLSERMGNENDNHHLYLVAMLYQLESSRLNTVDDKRARGRNRQVVSKSIGRWSDEDNSTVTVELCRH